MAAASSKPPQPQNEVSRDRLAVGTVIADRYRVEDVLGEGGMGTVYAAEHLALRKKVAVKVLHLDLLRLPNIVARFEREARATARIEHPNVTIALDFGRLPNGAMYLVLEYVEGRRLRDLLSDGALPLSRALHIAKQIASVLVAAQALGIVHRDLKPENVILVARDNDSDFVKVLDFGIARMASAEDETDSQPPLTKLGAVFGTPEYMAPEQALGQRVDSRADLYSLGVILFEMITGVRPYVQTGDVGILSQQITSPRPTFAERVPGIQVPEDVERLVYRLLAKGAQERYQRAADVVATLENVLASEVSKRAVPSIPVAASSEPLPSFDLMTLVPKLEQRQVKTSARIVGTARTWVRAGNNRVSLWTHSAFGVVQRQIDPIVDAVRRSGSDSVRQKLEAIPRNVLRVGVAAGAVFLVVVPIVLLVWIVRLAAHRGEVKAASVPSSTPTVVVVPSAAPAVSVVPTVLDESSKDPEVLLAIAVSRLESGKDSDALGFVIRALTRQVERRNDERVITVLYRTANSTQKDVSDKTIALLQGTMAAKGAELQYQLWLDRSVRDSVRKRIDRWLRSEAFERAASGAIHVAVKLRLAETCEKKAAMLPTAAKIGGTAALGYLEELQSTTGCGLDGKSDCYGCLRNDRRLTEAITQIRSRLNAPSR